jgi:hypothetical protein
MSNEKNRCSCGESDEKCPVHGDDVQSAERAQRKRNRIMNAPHTPLSKLAKDRGAKIDFVAFDEYKHIEPPRHPATDLVTALKLLKQAKLIMLARQMKTPVNGTDVLLWIGRVEKLLEMFPNLK